MDILNLLLIIISSIFILFLPGFIISFIFFSQGKIDFPERLALSFALSISIVPLFVFYTNLIGIPIRRETVFGEVCLIVLAGAIGVWVKNKFNLTKKTDSESLSKPEL